MRNEQAPENRDTLPPELTRSESSAQAAKRAARRRLVKAAASAPVVFTVASGTSVAAASSGMCDANSQELAKESPPFLVTSSPDGWMRLQVPKYDIRLQTQGSPVWVSGFSYNAAWYEVTLDGVAREISPLEMMSGDDNQPVLVEKQHYYLLVDYGHNTVHRAYPEATSVEDPIAGHSCWNSLTGASLTANFLEGLR